MRFEVDGHEIDYEVRGEGRPILLVHGLTTDRRILVEACEPVLGTMPGWQRIYLDLPGHGLSKGNPARGSADALVEALGAFVRGVIPASSERPLVLGYAYGGYLAQGLARDVETGGLFLVCPVVEADFAKRTVPPKRVAASEPDLPFSEDPREREAFVEIAVHQTRHGLAQFQKVVHPANVAVDAELVGAVRYRYAMARPYLGALQELEKPVTILCGRDDHWVGFEDAVRLARACRRSTYAAIADCGQLLPLEAPGQFRAHLTDWLGRATS